MPVERQPISVSQFCELLAIEPSRFIGIERRRHDSTGLLIVLEGDDMAGQTSGTLPQLAQGKSGKKAGGKKKGC